MISSDSLEFNVDLNNYSGSLDVLLELAKSQKVDLEKISITKLSDQFYGNCAYDFVDVVKAWSRCFQI